MGFVCFFGEKGFEVEILDFFFVGNVFVLLCFVRRGIFVSLVFFYWVGFFYYCLRRFYG